MGTGSALKYSLILGWLVSSLAVAAVAVLAVPAETRSAFFWPRLLWAQALLLLVWAGIGFHVFVGAGRRDSAARFGGIAPTIVLVVAGYALLSLALMLIAAVSGAGGRLHWIMQIGLFSAAAVAVVFLSVARATATAGLASRRGPAATPKQLHDLLAASEAELRGAPLSELAASVKRLREALLYSLHDAGALADDRGYHELSQDVLSLRDELATLTGGGQPDAERPRVLQEQAAALAARTKGVAMQQVGR